MDKDLDQFFKKSLPAALPKVEVPDLPKLEDIIKEEEPKQLSRREKARAKAEPEDRLRRTLFVGNLPISICKSKVNDISLYSI